MIIGGTDIAVTVWPKWHDVNEGELPVDEVLVVVDWYGEPTLALGVYSHEDREWFAQGIDVAFTISGACCVTHWTELPRLPE